MVRKLKMPGVRQAGIMILLLLISGCKPPSQVGSAKAPANGRADAKQNTNRADPRRPEVAAKAILQDGEKIDVDPDDKIPGKADMARLLVPRVVVTDWRNVDMRYDPKSDVMSFTSEVGLINKSIAQVKEVDLALQIVDHGTDHVIFRSDQQPITKFHNERVLYIGTLEGVTRLIKPTTATFQVPAHLWTTGVDLEVVVVRALSVDNPSDLHDFGNMTAFLIQHSTAEIERRLLKEPSLFKLKSNRGSNMALTALADGTPRLCKFMMRHGVDLHAKSLSGADAMYYAVMSNSPKNLDFALQQGFSPRWVQPISKATTLLFSISLGYGEATKWLIAHGADVNHRAVEGATPLSEAIRANDRATFDLLVKAHANYRARDKYGESLMHFAAHWNYTILPRLKELGLPVDGRNNYGTTPLMDAAATQANDSARWLLANGADINAKDSKGRTVFDYAKMSNTLKTDMFFRRAVGLN